MNGAAIVEFLLQILAAGGGAAILAFGLFRAFGASWLENKFAEKLESFRHEQAKELQRLRAKIDGDLDATLRSQQREFEVLSDSWRLTSIAFGAASDFLNSFQSYQDINKMTPQMRREYLQGFDFLQSQISEIEDSENPTNSFIEARNLEKNNRARQALRDMQNYLVTNQVFLESEISDQFFSVAKGIHEALVSKEVGMEAKDWNMQSKGQFTLDKLVAPKITEISEVVRGKFFSRLSATDVSQ